MITQEQKAARIAENKDLIEGILGLKIKKKVIEDALKMPENSLSGMLSGSRDIPLKWQLKLQEYLKPKHPEQTYKETKGVDVQPTEPKKDTPPKKKGIQKEIDEDKSITSLKDMFKGRDMNDRTYKNPKRL